MVFEVVGFDVGAVVGFEVGERVVGFEVVGADVVGLDVVLFNNILFVMGAFCFSRAPLVETKSLSRMPDLR